MLHKNKNHLESTIKEDGTFCMNFECQNENDIFRGCKKLFLNQASNADFQKPWTLRTNKSL